MKRVRGSCPISCTLCFTNYAVSRKDVKLESRTARNNITCEHCSLAADKGYSRFLVKYCIFAAVFYVMCSLYEKKIKRIYFLLVVQSDWLRERAVFLRYLTTVRKRYLFYNLPFKVERFS